MATILATKYDWIVVYIGTVLSLALMILLTVYLSHFLLRLIDPSITNIIAGFFFLFFGLKLIWDAY